MATSLAIDPECDLHPAVEDKREAVIS